MSTWRRSAWSRADLAPGPPHYGPLTINQRDFYDLAFSWADSQSRQKSVDRPKRFDPFGAWWGEHLISTTASSFTDTWDFTTAYRRADLPMRSVPRTGGPLPADVVAMFVPDPVPGRIAYGLERDHYHVRYGPDGAIEVRIWERLGLDPPAALIGIFGDKRYFTEVCFKALLEAWLLIAEENWPGTISELAGAFGSRASWDSGQLESQVKFAVIEHMKDMLFSGRVFTGRPIRRLTRQRYEDLIVKFMGRGRWPKGPCEPVIGGRNGNLVTAYTMPVAKHALPPRPVWTPLGSGEGWQGPEDYDHPILVTAGGSTLNSPAVMWAWGGSRNGAHPLPPFLDAPQPPSLNPYDRDDPIRPPAPGSMVHLRVAWGPPLGPIPSTPPHLEINPITGEAMKPGEFAFDMGDPEAGAAGGPFAARQGGRGVTWCIGDDPSVPYSNYVFPHEIYDGRAKYTDLSGRHYFPAFFDFSKPGSWELGLTVPEHGGQLALRFAWNPIWADVTDGTTMTFPIQLYIESPTHNNFPQYYQFPHAKLLPPPVLPEGLVQTQAAEPGQFAIRELVHGDRSELVALFDPPAHGISTKRHA